MFCPADGDKLLQKEWQRRGGSSPLPLLSVLSSAAPFLLFIYFFKQHPTCAASAAALKVRTSNAVGSTVKGAFSEDVNVRMLWLCV